MAFYRHRWGPWLTDLAGLPRGLYTEEQIAMQDPVDVGWWRERALRKLREVTGQDFGYDVEKWRAWLLDHPECMHITDDKAAELNRKYGRLFHHKGADGGKADNK